MRRLLGYMRPYRLRIAVSLVFLLAQSALQVMGPLLTRTAVDRYIAPTGAHVPGLLARFLPADAATGLARIGLLYLAVLTGSFVCEFAQMYLMQYTGQLAMFDLRRQLMQHLQDLDLTFYDRNPVGRLVTRVTSDVDVLNDLFASGLVTILGDVLVLVFILGIMFSFSPLLTAIMLTAMPFVILPTVIFRRVTRATAASPSPGSPTAGAHHGISPALHLSSAQPEFEEVNQHAAFVDAGHAMDGSTRWWFISCWPYQSSPAGLQSGRRLGRVAPSAWLRFFRPIQTRAKNNIPQSAGLPRSAFSNC